MPFDVAGNESVDVGQAARSTDARERLRQVVYQELNRILNWGKINMLGLSEPTVLATLDYNSD